MTQDPTDDQRKLGAALLLSFYACAFHDTAIKENRNLGQQQLAMNLWQRAKPLYAQLGNLEMAAQCDLFSGQVLSRIGQHDQAIMHWEQAHPVYFQLRQDENVASCYQHLGDSLKSVKRYRQAIERYEQAKEIFYQLSNEKEAANCEQQIGAALYALEQPKQALPYYERAKQLHESLGLIENAAHCNSNLGCVHRDLGHLQDAVSYFEQARKTFFYLCSKTKRVGAAYSQNMTESLQEGDSNQNPLFFVATCDLNLGSTLRQLGQTQQAIERYEQAKKAFLNLGFEKEANDCDFNYGVVLLHIGQQQQAIEIFERVAKVYHRLGINERAAHTEFNIGTTLLEMGQAEQALEYFKQLREVYRRLDLQKSVADCDFNIRVALKSLGRQGVMGELEQIRVIYEERDFVLEVARVDYQIGLESEKTEDRVKHLERAKAVFLSQSLYQDAAYCDVNIAIALANQLRLVDALGSAFQQIMRGESGIIPMVEGKAKEEDSFASNIRSQYLEILARLENAISVFEVLRGDIAAATHRISFFEKLTISYKMAVEICLRLGQVVDAIHYLERSRSKVLAEAVTGNLIPDPNEVGHKHYVEFLSLRDRLLQLGILPTVRIGSGWQFNNNQEDGSKRGVYAQTQHDFAVLTQQIATEYPESSFTRRLNASEVRYLKEPSEYIALLPDDHSCLLEFLAWGDYREQLQAFLVTRQKGLEVLTFPYGSLKQLQSLWDEWQEMYNGRLNVKEKADLVWKVCHQLHDLIFGADVRIGRDGNVNHIPLDSGNGKLSDYLNATLEAGDDQQARRMYLIPHSFLFLLPLHAACKKEVSRSRPHYLIDDFAVVYSPSAYMLKVSQQRKRQLTERPRALVVGNPMPIYNAKPLEFAADEARWVTEQLKQKGWVVDELIEDNAIKELFLNGDGATVAGIKKGSYYHLHLAQHGGIDDSGHHAYLYFSQSSKESPAEEYKCTMWEIAGAPLHNTESVLVPACYTWTTPPSLSEFLGMGAAFLQAGVGTFVGSLFELSDEGSNHLMKKVYELHFEGKLNWSEALRQAQLWMSGGSPTRVDSSRRGETMNEEMVKRMKEMLSWNIPATHPYNWAAFVVNSAQ